MIAPLVITIVEVTPEAWNGFDKVYGESKLYKFKGVDVCINSVRSSRIDRLTSMRSNSEASVLLHPIHFLICWMMTEKALFILSPMLWNITIAIGMPKEAYPIVNAERFDSIVSLQDEFAA